MVKRNTQMTSSIFISHTKGRSADFSIHFSNWLSSSPIAGIIEPWHAGTQESLSVGTYSHLRIVQASEECSYCISIITEENVDFPWINFEAGLFFAKKSIKPQLKPIVTVLCGNLTYDKISASHPLQPIYSVKASNKSALNSLLKTIRDFTGKSLPKDSAIDSYINSDTTEKLIIEHNKIFSEQSSKIIDAKNGIII